ncbi:hypothetical protein BDW75DRAFT_28948 [Aspergillus navahoensis]
MLCGNGGSGLYIGVMTLPAATATLHERPRYVANTGLTWGLYMVLGPTNQCYAGLFLLYGCADMLCQPAVEPSQVGALWNNRSN